MSVAAATLLTALSEGGYGPRFVAAAGLLAWVAVILIALTRPRRGDGLPRAARAAALLISAYGGWALASAFWAPDPGRAVTEAAKLLTYAGAFSALILLIDRKERRAWLGGLAAGLAAVAAVACAARFFPGLAGDRESLAAFLPSAQGRLGYPVGYWNALGACMAITIVLLTALAAYSRTFLVRCACVAFLPVPALVIYLASSRASAGAALLGVGILALLCEKKAQVIANAAIAAPGAFLVAAYAADQPALLQGLDNDAARDQGLSLFAVTAGAVLLTLGARYLLERPMETLALGRRARRGALAGAGIAVVAIAIAADPVQRWAEFKDPPDFGGPDGTFATRHIQSFNGNGRYQFWSTAVDAVRDSPAIGQGAGGYEPFWYREGELEYRLRDAHSVLFESAAELGVLGLLAIGGFFSVVVVAGIQRILGMRRRGLDPGDAIPLAIFATGLAAVVVDWSWEVPATALPMLVAAAMLTTRAPDDGMASRAPTASWPRAALAFAGCCCALVLGHQLLVQEQLHKSRDLAAAGDLGGAGDAAERAEALEPWAPAAYTQQALIAEQLGDTSAALRQISEALERSAEDWRVWVLKARFELERGDSDAAVAALREARRLNPRATILAPGRHRRGCFRGRPQSAPGEVTFVGAGLDGPPVEVPRAASRMASAQESDSRPSDAARLAPAALSFSLSAESARSRESAAARSPASPGSKNNAASPAISR